MLYDNNPFKLLDVSPSDGRRVIVRKAEEQALLIDAEKCSEARTVLTNPQRRISAEINWFLDCSTEEVKEIEAYISDTRSGNTDIDGSWDTYSPLTQLNIQLACLDYQNFAESSRAKYYILGISRLFETVNSEDVLRLINEKRSQAGFPEVSSRQDIDNALSEVRNEIRQRLSQKLQKLPEQKYIHIVTLLSESYSGNQRYKGHAILEDTISEYQLYINDKLHKQGQSIIKTARFIEQGAKRINASQAVADLVESLYAWDKLAQPLQLGALTKGTSHEESEEMLSALRDLSLKLHNEYGLSSESLAITKAIQEVFIELPEYTEMLNNDSKVLTRLVDEKNADEALGPILDSVKGSFEALKSCPTNQRENELYKLVQAIVDASLQINDQYPDRESSDKFRGIIGVLARSFALELHNDLERTEEALKLVNAIEPVFSDLPSVAEKLHEDKETLTRLKEEQEDTQQILDELKSLQQFGATIKASPSQPRIDEFISRVKKLDERIKKLQVDAPTKNKVRENLCYMARDVAIELHNSKHKTPEAIGINKALYDEFSDLPSLKAKLSEDYAILWRQLTSGISSQKSSKASGCLVSALVWLVLLMFLFAIPEISSSCGSSSSSTKSTSTSSSYSSSSVSTPKPTATLTPQTMPANGKVFYCSSTDRPSSFKVTNSGSSNYYMKFVKAGTDTTVITFFVRANSTAVIDMPAGKLELRYAYGSTWYGEKKLFGENTMYAKDDEYYDFTNYTWEISLYTKSSLGETMDVEYIDANEF